VTKQLFTIGYEGASIDEFVANLSSYPIDVLIDVRELPLSRKRGFSKNSLRSALDDQGIEYLHLRGLGDPKSGRIAAREGRYADFRRIFSNHLRSSAAREDLSEAIDVAVKRTAVLLCFEKDHRNCHRCIVADEMATLGNFQLVHL
jgi:uncharacterized protein (DUF488 family)